MDLTYNSNTDTFHVLFVDTPGAKQEDVGHGVVLHFDKPVASCKSSFAMRGSGSAGKLRCPARPRRDEHGR